MKKRISIYSIVVLFGCISSVVEAQTKDSIAVRQAAAKFIQSFNALQWRTFHTAFADDATVFFPEWEQVRRKAGRKEVENAWLEIFPEFKDSTSTLGLNISPKDMLIQIYGRTAIVTFHLGSGEKGLARRTLVMVKNKREWKIVHLHASYIQAIDKG